MQNVLLSIWLFGMFIFGCIFLKAYYKVTSFDADRIKDLPTHIIYRLKHSKAHKKRYLRIVVQYIIFWPFFILKLFIESNKNR